MYTIFGNSITEPRKNAQECKNLDSAKLESVNLDFQI